MDFHYPCLSLDDPTLWKQSKRRGEVIKIQYHTHWYSGKSATAFKKPICIYVPYGYDTLKEYNVMVLLPGMDMPYSCYLSRAHRYSPVLYSVQFQNVLDNLIDAKVIEPSIIVTLPYYGATVEGHPVMELDGNQLINELRYDLLPYMISNYSTYAKGTDSISISNAREHFGTFGFSYTSTMIPKYIIPECIDLFSWFGASSIFHADLSSSIKDVISEIGRYSISFFYAGCGDKDNAYAQTHEMYNTFLNGVPDLSANSDLVIIPNCGHDARTYDTAIINCLLKFFDKES